MVEAITSGPLGRIAVCFVGWSSAGSQRTVVDWTVIADAASATAFAEALAQQPRSSAGETAIGTAIDYAVRATAQSAIASDRRLIDVSGDGINNDGRDVAAARDDAVAAGFTINGLAILNKRVAPFKRGHTNPEGGIEHYYRENVIGGPGAFVLAIEGVDSFASAITEKLVMEIAALLGQSATGVADGGAQRRPSTNSGRGE